MVKAILRGIITGIILTLIALSAAASITAPVDSADSSYRIGYEDVIQITVARHPEFSGEFYIPADGAIILPGIGQVKAAGKTLVELSQEVAKQLRPRLREPEVSVILKTPRMQRIYVLGTVKTPGLYDMKPDWRITEAFAAAGGLAEGFDTTDCTATVLRAATGERLTSKLQDVIHGTPDANTPLKSGDVVSIEAFETIPVHVVGKVKNPGLYKLRKNSPGLMEALAQAGGVLEEAALSKVAVNSLSGSSRVVNLIPAMVEGNQNVNVVLQPGDLVVVPEETARIAILGYVNTPGFYPMKDGQKLTLSDALGLAKGVDNKRASVNSIAVMRSSNGKQEKLVFNLNKFLKSGDSTQNPEIIAGDIIYVPETGKLDWDSVWKAVSAIGFAFF